MLEYLLREQSVESGMRYFLDDESLKRHLEKQILFITGKICRRPPDLWAIKVGLDRRLGEIVKGYNFGYAERVGVGEFNKVNNKLVSTYVCDLFCGKKQLTGHLVFFPDEEKWLKLLSLESFDHLVNESNSKKKLQLIQTAADVYRSEVLVGFES